MQEPNADKDAEYATSRIECLFSRIFDSCFRICANFRREIGDSSVDVAAPAAAAQAPQPMEVGSGSSGDDASLYD